MRSWSLLTLLLYGSFSAPTQGTEAHPAFRQGPAVGSQAPAPTTRQERRLLFSAPFPAAKGLQRLLRKDVSFFSPETDEISVLR